MLKGLHVGQEDVARGIGAVIPVVADTSTTSGIALLEDDDHRFVFANKRYREDFIGDMSFVGRHAAEVISGTNLPHLLRELSTVRETGRTTSGRETVLHKKTASSGEQVAPVYVPRGH